MKDSSEAKNDYPPRRAIKSSPVRLVAYLVLFALFAITVFGMLWYIFVAGYIMRSQDWLWLGFNVIGTIVGAGALWEEWRLRRTAG